MGFKFSDMVAMGQDLEISRKQSLAQTDGRVRTPIHIWVTGNHRKSTYLSRTPRVGVIIYFLRLNKIPLFLLFLARLSHFHCHHVYIEREIVCAQYAVSTV